MKQRATISTLTLALTLALPLGCLAPAPNSQVETAVGTVRADSTNEASRVSELLLRLRPELMEILPGAREVSDLEVWIQDRPSLYAVPGKATSDAEGLWAESHSRILLARGADHLERTLAHELVHAHLGEDWATLPGTLEEGLCDQLSSQLAPDGAARLRAGRLSSAALICGGMQLELKLKNKRNASEWSARIALSGSKAEDNPQHGVFKLAAGLSSTRLEPSAKRGYYGLAFLLVDRIVRHRGVRGLHALCLKARDQGFGHIPRPWLLEAAQLSDETEAWRQAALEALGRDELTELVQMHPSFAIDALVEYLRSQQGEQSGEEVWNSVTASLSLVGSNTTLRLDLEPSIRSVVLRRLAGSADETSPPSLELAKG